MRRISFYLFLISFLIGLNYSFKHPQMLSNYHFKSLSETIKDSVFQGYFCQISKTEESTKDQSCSDFNKSLFKIVLNSLFIKDQINFINCNQEYKNELDKLFSDISYVFYSMKMLEENHYYQSSFLKNETTKELFSLSKLLETIDIKKCFIEKE